MRKILILLYVLSCLIAANECHTSYNYIDNHQIETTVNHKTEKTTIKIAATLYLRYTEDHNHSYIIGWLKNPDETNDTKTAIDTESIYAPFLVERALAYPDSFIIHNLKIPSRDPNIYRQTLGIMDILQYRDRTENYRVLHANGHIEIRERSETKSGNIRVSYGDVYTKNVKDKHITYLQSDITIVPSDTCKIWKSVSATQKVKIHNQPLKITMTDDRTFALTSSKNKLSREHWFFQLGTDITTWHLGKAKPTLSLTEASKIFSVKHKEMLSLVDDSQRFEEWVKHNESFLAHLDILLENHMLDNKVSKKLFAMLGYLNSPIFTNVLGRIILNDMIQEKERFRGLMALKNTSTPINTDTLTEILDFGLSSDNGDDFIQNATGMLLGSMAKERLDHASEQFEEIKERIISAIQNKEIKTISLSAAGNMLDSAPDDLITEVDTVLLTADDTSTRRESAHALDRIERSNVTTEQFVKLIGNEKNSDTKKALIGASASSPDFTSNSDFQYFLIREAKDHKNSASIRIEALSVLEKTDFGKNREEKILLRNMMYGEKNSDIIKYLKKLYRR